MDKQSLFRPLTDLGAARRAKQGHASKGGLVSSNHETVQGREEGDKKVLRERDAYDKLGYSYPTWRKWQILIVMFIIQISINLNASLYANGVTAISMKFGLSAQAARVPQLTFLCAYAIGCELWAPWSEELGRWPTQQLSLLLVNIWQIPCALAPNFATLIVCRALGGLSTAGGSVTLGVVADMWGPDEQEYAVAFLVLSSVGGSVVGPVIGGFLEQFAPLIWIFWTQLIFGGFVQALHFFTVPETRSSILLDREAKRRRAAGEEEVYGPNEVDTDRLSVRDVLVIWGRPFHMLFTEPIVAWLSAVSGFSDSLIFTFLQGFTPVFKKWNFTTYQLGLSFLPLIIGYFLAYLSYLPSIHHFRQKRRKHGSKSVPPEARLWWLLFVILLEPIGLLIFAWTSLGPDYHVHWIGPMFATVLVGMANYSIYQSSIDYTVAAYGVYAASATGGNDFARDFLSGIAALYSEPMFAHIGSGNFTTVWPSLILAIVAVFATTPLFYFYRNGERIRMNSKFASKIAEERDKEAEEMENEKKGGTNGEVQHVEQGPGGPSSAAGADADAAEMSSSPGDTGEKGSAQMVEKAKLDAHHHRHHHPFGGGEGATPFNQVHPEKRMAYL